MKFKGKVALITGGSGGIGSAVSRSLAREGAKVVIFSRDQKALKKIANEIHQDGGTALALLGDVSRQQDAQKAVAATLRKFKRLDILVNCAGVQEPIGLFVKTDAAKWRKNVEVNLFGTVYFAHAVLPHMLKRKSGAIVNFSGGGASGTRPYFSAYAVAKTGVVKFTEILATETEGTGIRVNAVAPGAVNTGMLEEVLKAGARAGKEFAAAKIRKVKGGTPPDLAAELVVFLASSDSHTLSGKLIAAIWDGWKKWNKKDIEKIQKSDRFTLRRVT
jgi:NAD(P)-dependent dehydrogenase (short-subunit alcohol dehydrogenase family)